MIKDLFGVMKLALKGIFQTPITDFIYHQVRGHFMSPRNGLVATINASSKSILNLIYLNKDAIKLDIATTHEVNEY